MATDIIQAQYDQLDNIASRFRHEAENSAVLQQQVAQIVQTLQGGGWEGEGAKAFFAEMETAVFPTMQRLKEALEEASTAT